MILSNAAKTPVDGAVVVVRREVCVGAGEAVAAGAFVTVFGVGVGLAVTVRVRLDGEVVSCATITQAATITIEAATRNLFMFLTSSIN
jgi:hypothetical protein